MKLMGDLQEFLLEDFIRLYQEGRLSPTDRRTLYQMLKDNGWVLDPTRLPKGILEGIREKHQFPEPPNPEDEDPI